MTTTTGTHAHRFDADTVLDPIGGGRFAAEVRPGWRAIGGQPNGGYLLALALKAVTASLPGSRAYAVHGHFLRPGEPGPAEIATEAVKLGRVKSTVGAGLTQAGKERVRLIATLGGGLTDDAPRLADAPPPPLPGPEECPDVPLGAAGPDADIVERFDYRLTPGTRWLTGRTGDHAVIEGWVRFSDGREPDLESLPLFADSFPPAIYEFVESGLVPTVELGVHLRRRPAPGWLQTRFRTRLLSGGLLEEDGEIWDSGGNLVAMSRQLALVLPPG